MTKEYFNRIYFGAWIICERHLYSCTCSYCQPAMWESRREHSKRSFGLMLPEDKSAKAWRVLWWKSGKNITYLRWTLPKTLRPFGRKLV